MKRLCLIFFISLAMTLLFVAGAASARKTPTNPKPQKAAVNARRDPDARPGGVEDEREEILARERYIYTRRAGGPDKQLPPDAYAKAIQQAMQLDRSKERTVQAVLPAWQSVNDGGMLYTASIYVSGRSNSIAFDPANPSVMYLASCGGGVWKTTDSGTNWIPTTDHLTTMASGAVAVDPQHPQTVYWASGELNYALDSYFGDGIFRTTDAGATWTKVIGSNLGKYFSQIVIDPTNTSVLYVSGQNGVHKSTNGGSTWLNMYVGTNANCVIMNPLNSQTLYASVGGITSNTLKKTTDGGNTWTTLNWPGSSAGRCQLAIAPGDTNILYASTDKENTNGGLYRSTDGGASWTLMNNTIKYITQDFYANAVTVSPANPDYVIVGGLDIYTSDDGGNTLTQRTDWTTTDPAKFAHADIHALVYNGTVLYSCTDGGIFLSSDDGVTWKDLNRTLGTLQYQGADYEPANVNTISGGMQDNGKSKTVNGGTTTEQVWGGDGGYTLIDPIQPQYYYSQYVNGSIERSTDYGLHYTEIAPKGTGGLFYNPFEFSPGDPDIVVYGQNDVWMTLDVRTADASGWFRVGEAADIGAPVSAIGISASDYNKIYIGTEYGRIYVTDDAGSTWRSKGPFNYVSDIAVDGTDDNIAYAVFGGAGMHVAKTTDAGVTWTNIGIGLPNAALNSIVLRQNSPRMIIVGGDVGVYYSTNEGANWNALKNGLPIAAIFDMKYKEGPKRLLAATHGRGCWMLNLGGFAFSASPYALAFGSVRAGTTKTMTVTVINSGASALAISSAACDNASFSVSPDNAVINGGDSAHFQVAFAPQSSGASSGTVTFTNSGITSPDAVRLTGTGVAAIFSANRPQVQFGNVRIDSAKTDTLIVTNTGNTMLHVTGIVSTSSAFTVAPASDSIAQGASKPFRVTFHPGSGGVVSGSIIFTDDGLRGHDTVAVSGGGAVATIVVSVISDVDGNPATTGDQAPLTWPMALYKDSISSATLLDQANASSQTFNLLAPGAYIVVQAGNGGYTVRVNGNLSQADTVQIGNSQTLTLTFIEQFYYVAYGLTARWNLLSTPVRRTGYTSDDLYPSRTSDLFLYYAVGGYQATSWASPGSGYWMKTSSAYIDTLFGAEIAAETVNVAKGWNLIGSISTPAPFSAVVPSPGDILRSALWGYDNGYRQTDVIQPGKGYWVKASAPGSIMLNRQSAPGFTPKNSAAAFAELNALTITDAKSNSQTLYFGPLPDAGDQSYEMPPHPPAGMFDVRYGSGKAAAYLAPAGISSPARILITSASYPLTVEWKFSGAVQPAVLIDGSGGSLFSISLDKTTGSAVIKDSRVTELLLKNGGAAMPPAYGLAQNFPNPFNPSTVIHYQLPEESRVTLKIFNLIGQAVRTLDGGIRPAGYESMEWNGADDRMNALPSGLYFYRLEAVSTSNPARSFTSTKKMELVR